MRVRSRGSRAVAALAVLLAGGIPAVQGALPDDVATGRWTVSVAPKTIAEFSGSAAPWTGPAWVVALAAVRDSTFRTEIRDCKPLVADYIFTVDFDPI
jgi:hypothetical protein